MIEQLLLEKQFDFIKDTDKQFICAFTNELDKMGYTFEQPIGSGFCWGKYMLIYHKANVKTRKIVARIYIRDDCIVLRLFFNDVTKHAAYIEQASDTIKNVFIGDYGTCKHCKGDACKFRKDYVIGGKAIEKCNGTTFEFHHPSIDNLPELLALFREFYPVKQRG